MRAGPKKNSSATLGCEQKLWPSRTGGTAARPSRFCAATEFFAIKLLVPLLLTAARSLAADWPQLQGNPQRTGYSAETIDAPFTRAWAHGFAPERLHPQAQPIVAGGQVFIGTEMGTFCAFDAKTGRQNWTRKLGAPILHTAGAEGGRVFVATLDGCVSALDAKDGAVLWAFDSHLRTGFSTAVLLAEGNVFVANRGGSFFALSQKDGAVLWLKELGAPLLMSSAYRAGTIFVGAMDLRVRALDAKNGDVLWTSEPLAGAALKDYWPVVHDGHVLVRPMPSSLISHGKGIEWQRGPLSDAALEQQQAMVEQLKEQPQTRNLYVLEAATGKESVVVPQWVTNTMNGAPTPPCVDGDGQLIVPVTQHDWRGGWGRLDLKKQRITELLCDGDFEFFEKRKTMRGTGNPDENLNVSAAGRLVFVMHTEEMNAHFTGAWHLDRRDWTQLAPIHADLSFSSNTQGGGGNPAVIAEGMIFHTSWNTLNARTAATRQPTP